MVHDENILHNRSPHVLLGPVSERLCVLDMKNDELTSENICTLSVRNEGLLR